MIYYAKTPDQLIHACLVLSSRESKHRPYATVLCCTGKYGQTSPQPGESVMAEGCRVEAVESTTVTCLGCLESLSARFMLGTQLCFWSRVGQPAAGLLTVVRYVAGRYHVVTPEGYRGTKEEAELVASWTVVP